MTPDSKQSQAPCPSARPSSDTCLQGAVHGGGKAFTLELTTSCTGKSPDNLLSLLNCCWGGTFPHVDYQTPLVLYKGYVIMRRVPPEGTSSCHMNGKHHKG